MELAEPARLDAHGSYVKRAAAGRAGAITLAAGRSSRAGRRHHNVLAHWVAPRLNASQSTRGAPGVERTHCPPTRQLDQRRLARRLRGAFARAAAPPGALVCRTHRTHARPLSLGTRGSLSRVVVDRSASSVASSFSGADVRARYKSAGYAGSARSWTSPPRAARTLVGRYDRTAFEPPDDGARVRLAARGRRGFGRGAGARRRVIRPPRWRPRCDPHRRREVALQAPERLHPCGPRRVLRGGAPDLPRGAPRQEPFLDQAAPDPVVFRRAQR